MLNKKPSLNITYVVGITVVTVMVTPLDTIAVVVVKLVETVILVVRYPDEMGC